MLLALHELVNSSVPVDISSLQSNKNRNLLWKTPPLASHEIFWCAGQRRGQNRNWQKDHRPDNVRHIADVNT